MNKIIVLRIASSQNSRVRGKYFNFLQLLSSWAARFYNKFSIMTDSSFVSLFSAPTSGNFIKTPIMESRS